MIINKLKRNCYECKIRQFKWANGKLTKLINYGKNFDKLFREKYLFLYAISFNYRIFILSNKLYVYK